jgi:hypothetical protein
MKPKSNATHSFDDKAGRATVGFCLWCNQNFYTSDELSVHNGDGAEACPVFKEFLSEQGVAPRPTQRKARKARVNEKTKRRQYRWGNGP